MPRTIALVRRLLLMMLPVLYLCCVDALEAECKRIVDNPELRAEIKKRLAADRNGLIVVLRHTSKCSTASEGCAKDSTMASCIDPQQPLSDSGDIEASSIGRSLSKLKVNENVRVLHSQYCRTTKTALLIFGKEIPRPESNLNSGCYKSETKGCYNWLKEQLKLAPSGNVFLITHSDNIEHLGFNDINASMPYGVAAIIDPSAKNKDPYQGCLLWDDWKELADGK